MQISREPLFEEDVFFASCHASTVLPMENGVILVCYFAGSREGADDVAIYLSRKEHGIWEKPRMLAKVNRTAHWNPVLMSVPGGARLIFKVGREISQWKSWTMVTSDAGRTWTRPVPYPAPLDDCGPVRNKPLYLSDGSMLAPASVETETSWRPRVDFSCDYGESFPSFSWIPLDTESDERITGKGAIQPALWSGTAGKIHALLRTTEGFIFRSDSRDYGRSWCTAYSTGLPSNNSGIDLAKLDGKLYLCLNPVSGNWADRTPLSILASSDNGQTFKPFVTLEDQKNDPRIDCPSHNRRFTAEFSYPAIVAKSGKLHVTYTCLRRQIIYREIIP